MSALLPDEGGFVAVSTILRGRNVLLHPLTAVGRNIPTVSDVTPADGPSYGGIDVTITGSFLGDATVTFDGNSREPISRTDTSITFTVPEWVPSTVSVEHSLVISARGEEFRRTYVSRGTLVVTLRGWTSNLDIERGSREVPFRLLVNDVESKWNENPEDRVFRVFSYDSTYSKTLDRPYSACQTLAPLLSSEQLLHDELREAIGYNGTDLYLVGHSQGGILALGYLAYLKKLGRRTANL